MQNNGSRIEQRQKLGLKIFLVSFLYTLKRDTHLIFTYLREIKYGPNWYEQIGCDLYNVAFMG